MAAFLNRQVVMNWAKWVRAALFLGLMAFGSHVQAAWLKYPANLPQFDFSGDKLAQNWANISLVTFLPFPDKKALLEVFATYPAIQQELVALGSQPNAEPALKAAAAGDYDLYVARIQDLWRWHFEGKFEKSYQQGRKLGSLGAMPAMQSKLMYAHLQLKDPKQKRQFFEEIDREIQQYAKVALDHPFVVYGHVYARARLLQVLPMLKAQGTGYIESSIQSLKKLAKKFPKRGIYEISLAGMYAGIIEEAGSFLARTMYGATETKMINLYNSAMARTPKIPVVYNEYAIALAAVDKKTYRDSIGKLLKSCLKAPAYSAEEALNQQACRERLADFNQAK